MSGKMDAKDNLRTQWRGDRSHRRTLTGRFTERFVETRLPFCHHQRCMTDKAWLYYYDPTIQQQSSEWKHPSSPTLKKAKTVKSAG
ncbi:hypothetical protein TNCV_2813071 [Trichonephila clavipes]|nr:hypothetical protein TNCV_2813071 [Trichonephila clavipes]